jgi:hypothetical protein
MEGYVMQRKNIPWFGVEHVRVNAVDASTLLALAEHYGFPALPIVYPDYSKHMEIAKKPSAWEEAVWYLQQDKPWGTDMLKYAYLMMYDWYAQCRDYNKKVPIIVSSLFNDRTYLVLDEANKWVSSFTNPNPCCYYRVCYMLTRAEILGFPEITIPYFNYTIRADMEGWLQAAKFLNREKAIVWVINRLIEWIESGNPPAPRKYTNRSEEWEAVNGSSRYVFIYNSRGLRVWERKKPIE